MCALVTWREFLEPRLEEDRVHVARLVSSGFPSGQREGSALIDMMRQLCAEVRFNIAACEALIESLAETPAGSVT